MKNDTFTYDTSLSKGSEDGLSNPIFNFSFINVWANTHVNDVTVQNWNYIAYFNNASYQTENTLTINFSVSDIKGGSTGGEATTAPTVAPTVKPTVAPTTAPTVKPTVAPTVKPTVAPTTAPATGSKVLCTNETNKYETWDASWLTKAADDDVITLQYTCTDASHGNWGVMSWGASVDGGWNSGTSYNAASNPTDVVTATCTAAELKDALKIKKSSTVSYICLYTWNGGKIVSLSISDRTAKPTVAPTTVPTTAPTVAPTVAPTTCLLYTSPSPRD